MKKNLFLLFGFGFAFGACTQSTEPLGSFSAEADAATDSALADAPEQDAADSGVEPPAQSVILPNVDPRPITAAEAECAGLMEPTCAGCHQLDDRWYLNPYWAPPPPANLDVFPEPQGCTPPPRANELSPEAIECFGLNAPACVSCHTADGQIFLRPWGDIPPPPVGIPAADPACYDLL